MSILFCTPIIIGTSGDEIIVSTEDYERLSEHRWWVMKRPNVPAYAHTQLPSGERVYMHRLILGAKKGEIVHHKNDNGLDNRRENLVICTQADNVRRRRGNAGASGFRGVSYIKDRPRKPWRARIKFDRKFIYLGGFETIKEAKMAYNQAAIKYFGEFARLHG